MKCLSSTVALAFLALVAARALADEPKPNTLSDEEKKAGFKLFSTAARPMAGAAIT